MQKLFKNGKKKTRIKSRFFFLPPYFPQGNPDEYLNNDITQNIHQKNFPKNDKELKRNIYSFFALTTKNPAESSIVF